MFVLGCKRHGETAEQFGIGKAMAMFYDNFDPANGTSKTSFTKEDSVYTYGEPMTVRPLFSAFVTDEEKQHFVLLTYAVQRKISFLRNRESNYFDLELALSGTNLPDSEKPRHWRARNVKGIEVLSFREGKYVQVSRSGDLTTVDQAVAERESLK